MIDNIGEIPEPLRTALCYAALDFSDELGPEQGEIVTVQLLQHALCGLMSGVQVTGRMTRATIAAVQSVCKRQTAELVVRFESNVRAERECQHFSK